MPKNDPFNNRNNNILKTTELMAKLLKHDLSAFKLL